MRTIGPSHQNWVPLPYMERAVDFLCSHYSAGLPLKPGGRKTSITLAAFLKLKREGKVRHMLVVAPLRVARQVWKQEGKKWTEFQDLTFASIVGEASKRRAALNTDADIYLINYENLPWLADQYVGRPLPFDVVVFDELTKMQNPRAERVKAIRPRLSGVRYRWGLTGSLFAKGHMSIFGQQLILDDGAALGRYITHYRDTYFSVGFNGFDYNLMPGGEKRIVDKLSPYWFYMDEADYAQLPPLIDVPHIADMEPQQKALYGRMKTLMIADLPGGQITAANAGAAYSKMAQMANGAVYNDGHKTNDDFQLIHDLKLDMLEEIIDELDGEPLLVGYEFQHDLLRIQERFGKRFGGQVPYLGAGTTHKQEDQWVREWNQRKLPLLLAHPQSAGHGLNMQEGQAYNVAWFSVTWDWELYDQFIRRVRRSGNTQARIFNHLLIIRGTIDEEKLASVEAKDMTERRLLASLNSQILSDGQVNRETEMVAKLSRPGQGGGAAPVQQGQNGGEPANTNGAPAGWGKLAGGDQTQEQRNAIQNKIAPDRTADAQSQFSGGIAEKTAEIANTNYGETAAPKGWGGQAQQEQAPPPQGEQTRAAPAGWGGGQQADAANAAAAAADAPKATRTRTPKATVNDVETTIIEARARVLAAVIASAAPDDEIDDITDIAREFMKFVVEG